MIIAVILLSIASMILLIFTIQYKIEIKSISDQLQALREKETNQLVHSRYSRADKLILEINFLLKDVRQMHIDYQKKNHVLDQMMTNISHDLRTPLTSAMGYLDIIQHSEMTKEEKSHELALVEKRLLRLEELINSFFEMAQIISSEKPPEKVEMNLVSVLEEAIAHYYDDYSKQGRKIILDGVPRRIMLHSNQNMLLRIFDNLMSNALKHGQKELMIAVKDSENLEISFSNEFYTANLDMNHIFDEFYTTDTSRTKSNTGLGLAIAKQFTEILGGKIQASQDGKLFVITLLFPKPH